MDIIDLSEENKNDYFTCMEEWSDEMKDGVCRKECWYNTMQEKGQETIKMCTGFLFCNAV